MKELNGKVAIVTGAGQGIGRGTTLELAKAGAMLILADLNGQTLEKVKREVEEIGTAALTVQMDVSKWEDAQRMAASALDRFGRIDILVNNAGIHPQNEQNLRFQTLQISDSEWDLILDVNLKGQFNCSKAVMPSMIKQRYGRIVNVSSVTGLTGLVGSAAYCASKAGIMALTKVMAREYGPYNITVNCIAPGLTMTAMNENVPTEILEGWIEGTPLRRAGQPVDMAHAILGFLKEELFVTGQTLVVDGGYTMH
jgi:3-oxoacyl-[acyl-carrier protein] reductase